MTLVAYPNCGTCKKAVKWLDNNEITYTYRNIKEEAPTEEEIRAWFFASGLPLKKFFNTSGQVYRSLGLSKKLPEMSEDEQIRLLASDGMLVKRPILLNGDTVLVGFREADYEALLG